MSERDSPRGGIERRGVLAALAAGIGAAGVAGSSLARQADVLDASNYVVEQGGRCHQITPLSGDETVEAFYDYRTPNTSPSGDAYSSYGTTDLQRAETSICFLYDGPRGLSLVVVHDRLRDGTGGGAVTFEFALEYPDRGSWVVGDDDYDAPTNYDSFTATETGWTVDWTWGEGRSDGGALRPLGEEFGVTIDPAFNEAAALYGDPYEGEITQWQVLSGDRSDPERVSLALDQPLTIRSGTCAGTRTTTTTRRETTTEERSTEEATDDEATTDASDEPVRAELEILPGKVNPRSHGRLPVVVRSSDAFDATDIERDTVAFGPGDAQPVKRIRTDADGDGRADLKLHFWMDATGIGWDTEEVELTAETERGRSVVCTADVELVPGGDEDEEDESNDDRPDDGDDDEVPKDEDENAEEDEDGVAEDDDEEDGKEEDDDEDEKEEDDDEEEDDGDDGDAERENRGAERDRGNGEGRGDEAGPGKGNRGSGDDNPGRGNGDGNPGRGNGGENPGRGAGNGRDDGDGD